MEKYHYIEKYFEGTLSPEETLVFNTLLEEDAEFASSFNDEKNIKKAIALNERKALKQKLQSFEKPKKSYQWMYVAASITVLLGIFAWNSLWTTNYDSLYKDYYQTYPNTVAPTVRGENANTIKSDAFYAYDSGDYRKAVALFSEIYAKDGEDYAIFYEGLSYMELGKYREALAVFELHDYTKENAFTPFFRWYKALLYIKLKNKSEAITLLEKLSKTDNPQKEAATGLLKELK